MNERIRAKLKIVIMAAGIFLLFIAAAGCNEYRAEVTVLPDGTGTRSVKLTVDIDKDNGKKTDIGLIQSLLSLEGSTRWKRAVEKEDRQQEGSIEADKMILDETRVTFICDHKADRLEEWPEMSGDIHIRGSLDPEKGNEVNLFNRISLERTTRDKNIVFSYREVLEWKGIRIFILDYISGRYIEDVQAIFPWIDATDKAGLKGLAAGHFGMAFDQIDDDEIYNALLSRISVSLLETSLEILNRSGKEVDETALKEVIDTIVWDRDNSFDSFLESSLPGASLAFSTELRLTVSLPGRILDTNGEISEDGLSVYWKIGLLDPFTGPVEMYAVSESQVTKQ